MDKITILLIDQHVLFRQGLSSLISGQSDWDVVGQSASISESVALVRRLDPDIVLMDLELSDGTGLDAAREMLADCPHVRIVFLTSRQEDELLFEAIGLGAKGFLPKDLSVGDLLNHLRGVARGEAAITPAVASRVLNAFASQRAGRLTNDLPRVPTAIGEQAFCCLTHREREVLKELVHGATNQEIADLLIISENTVKHHVGSILSKLQLRNRRDAVRLALHD